MNRFKLSAAATLAIFLAFSKAYAQDESSSAVTSQEAFAEALPIAQKKALPATANPVQMPSASECMKMEDCCPDPCKSNWFFVTADALYWKSHEDGLAYAVVCNAPAVAGEVQASNKVKEADGDWNWGFRAGIGYERVDEACCREDKASSDVVINWTYYHNNSHHTASVDDFGFTVGGGGFVGNWVADTLLGTFNTAVQTYGFGPSASATWKLNYNTVDAEFGRNYFVGKPFSFRPHFGLRGAGINQRLIAHYQSFDTPSALTLPNKYFGKDDFFGVGLRGGANMMWHFCENFGIFGNLSGSLVYGKFKVKVQANEVVADPGPPVVLTSAMVTTDYDFRTVQPNIELGIGIMWEAWPDDDDYHFSLAAAYEMVEWFNQNRFYVINSVHTNSAVTSIVPLEGDLNLQGLTIKARFEF